VVEHYGWDRVAARVHEIYRDVIGARAEERPSRAEQAT
jgi:hypothetical protein